MPGLSKILRGDLTFLKSRKKIERITFGAQAGCQKFKF
jgi:hypothetical protein